MSGFQAAIAWNLATSSFYKAGGRPWKIQGIRDGVCYVGLVFKRDERHPDPQNACCAAQMFLDSGDGVVFKGAVGPWYVSENKQFHLSRQAASELIQVSIAEYVKRFNRPPRELFIHGRTWFNEDEWRGFFDSVDSQETNLVGVRIADEPDMRLFRFGTRPVVRGLTLIKDERTAYLWTKGYAARLRTYVGREVPRPVRVNITRGDADVEIVAADILALTKLNYNSCRLGDGMPVTLVFADALGELLTAGPLASDVPLPFRHYI
jgi:hypothetical protein